MNVLLSATLSASLLAALAWPQAARVRTEDLSGLTGARRAGTLTCTDYQSNRRVSIPSNLIVTEPEGEDASRVFERNVYSWSR